MNRKIGLLLTFAFFACVAASLAAEDKPAAPRRPNILFIMTDQQRWDCVGVNGITIIQTPNMDRLAAMETFVCVVAAGSLTR